MHFVRMRGLHKEQMHGICSYTLLFFQSHRRACERRPRGHGCGGPDGSQRLFRGQHVGQQLSHKGDHLLIQHLNARVPCAKSDSSSHLQKCGYYCEKY